MRLVPAKTWLSRVDQKKFKVKIIHLYESGKHGLHLAIVFAFHHKALLFSLQLEAEPLMLQI